MRGSRLLGLSPPARLSALIVGASILLVGVARAERVGFEKRTSKVPGQLAGVARGDLDGDGWEDVIAVYRRGFGRQAQRYIGIFFRQKEGIGRAPDVAFSAPKDAVVFDVGDLDGEPGKELVYLTHTGLWSHAFSDRKVRSVTKRLSVLSLISDPEGGDLERWRFVRKIVPEGPTTVLIPGRRDLRMFRVVEGAIEPYCRVRVERRSSYDVAGTGLDQSSRDGNSTGGYAFRVTTTIPNLKFVEATGDDAIDLVTHSGDYVSVHPGHEDGCFSKRPVRRQLMGMRTPEELREGSATVLTSVADLDRDGIADLALTKISGGLTNLRTEIRLHRGVKGGGFAPKPQQVFKSPGFGAFARFDDIDGDGSIEMVQPSAEISILGITRILLSSSIAIDVLIRRASDRPGELFTKQPVQVLRTIFGLDFSSPNGMLGAVPIFGEDFDEDGRPDVLLSKGRDQMGLHRGLEGLKPFDDRDGFGLDGLGSYATTTLQPGHGRPPEVLVWYPGRKGLDATLLTYRPSIRQPKKAP